MARQSGFVADTATQITNLLQFADYWEALKQEWEAMLTNGNKPTLSDVEAVFGAGVLTVAQYEAALQSMQAIVDSIHASATRAKLYRMKR